jgi:hypothetical protein
MNSKLLIISLILIIPVIIASWLLIHILAIFGIFLAIAYPLWWLLAPKQTTCLLCRAGREGQKCLFCRRVIKKREGTSPVNLSSAILNGLLIFVFSVISMGIVFGESQLLFKLGFPPTPKTVSFTIPAKGQYRIGEIFPMKIEISGIKTPINAVQADLSFDSSRLEIVDISTEDSFANIFIQKEINNQEGYARLTGGLPNPGFFSDHGVFGTVFFKAKAPGVVKVAYLPSSIILANDGRGTDVLKDLTSVSYLILPEKISQGEENLQTSAISKSAVLGESTNATQMIFYNEGGVLGAKTGVGIQEQNKFSLSKIFLDVLEQVDRFILEQWQNALNGFR